MFRSPFSRGFKEQFKVQCIFFLSFFLASLDVTTDSLLLEEANRGFGQYLHTIMMTTHSKSMYYFVKQTRLSIREIFYSFNKVLRKDAAERTLVELKVLIDL